MQWRADSWPRGLHSWNVVTDFWNSFVTFKQQQDLDFFLEIFWQFAALLIVASTQQCYVRLCHDWIIQTLAKLHQHHFSHSVQILTNPSWLSLESYFWSDGICLMYISVMSIQMSKFSFCSRFFLWLICPWESQLFLLVYLISSSHLTTIILCPNVKWSLIWPSIMTMIPGVWELWKFKCQNSQWYVAVS